jgi:hypothetical protein
VELLIASSVATLITGTTMLVLLETAKENRRGYADSTVEQVASELQGKLIRAIRSMSASEGVAFSSPELDDSGALLGYKSIIVAQGPYPDYEREQISFNAGTGAVTQDSNLSSGTNALLNLAQLNTHAVVRALRFSPSLKNDGTVDNSLVNIFIEMDDNGYSMRSGSSHSDNPAYVWRTFSVKMRNN